MTDLTRLHAHEMAALLRRGEVSSHDLTIAHLDAAERDNRGLNAWLTIDRDRALAEASFTLPPQMKLHGACENGVASI